MITVKQYKEILDVASNFIASKNEGVTKDYHSGCCKNDTHIS